MHLAKWRAICCLTMAFLVFAPLAEGTAGPPQGRYAEFELESYLEVSSPKGKHVDVRNISSLGITAFSLEFRVELNDGTTSRYQLSTDFAVTIWYEQDPSLPHKAGVLHPGQLKRVSVPVPVVQEDGLAVTSFSVQLAAIVFADRSALGDRQSVASIFRSREAQQLVRQHWLQRLDEVLSISMQESQLRNRLRGFQSVLQNKSEIYGNNRVSSSSPSATNVEKGILENIEEALRVKSPTEFTVRLETLRRNLSEEFEIMTRHVTHDTDSLPTESQQKPRG